MKRINNYNITDVNTMEKPHISSESVQQNPFFFSPSMSPPLLMQFNSILIYIYNI